MKIVRKDGRGEGFFEFLENHPFMAGNKRLGMNGFH